MYEINSVIARNLRFLRVEQGLTYEYIAKVANMGKSSVEDIEKMKKHRPINPDFVNGIAKALGITPDVLKEDNDEIRMRIDNLKKDIDDVQFSENKSHHNMAAIQGEAIQLVELTSKRGPYERINALMMLGYIEFLSSRFADALSKFHQAYHIAEAIEDNEQKHKTRHNMAMTYLSQGNYNEVITIVMADLNEIVESAYRARDFFLLGTAFKQLRAWGRATDYLKTAIHEIHRSSPNGSPFEGRCYQILGDIQRINGNYRDSMNNTETAITMARKFCDLLNEIYSMRTMALTLYKCGKIDEAKKALQTANLKAREYTVVNDLEVAINTFHIGEFEKDFATVKKSISKIEQFETPPRDLALKYETAARIAMEIGSFKEGQVFYEKAIKILAE
ncbi:helix-turn-helix domain-containing protein [Tumebacillus avium]|nr:helix-turn-helix transcriptional regulator [Tumebacillus avium]